ncbi:MAG TPA: type 1 glutamine amidotransferase domain-containing protein [Acidiphilium sp.]|nr:MAG: glutamine amidotransferase [Acidiphilium sp. 21-60-14]OYV91517.1 MAG: glutamine amidotransferase [Acidiphilium sp. 37-60-79]HQT87166.1 type 1 glutamine amidotransferase domain-containing protein [Acidiphilium sp.]HQU23694.1 type 1 glutamine amidotransferase domain-containing protein [Acidiphilium sp.]
MSHILIVTTSHSAIPGAAEPTGVWFEELAAPYYAFIDAGASVTIASIAGGAVPIDGRSLTESPLPATVTRFQNDTKAMHAMTHSKPITNLDPAPFDAIFLPGGHGTMWDLPGNKALGIAITRFDAAGKIVAAVCHGPAAFAGLKGADGADFIKGRSITCFTDSEERAVKLDDKVPFLLETTLREQGAKISTGADFAPHVIADRNLLTGQNPKSSAPLADAVIKALNARPAKAA